MPLTLKTASAQGWLEAVLASFDEFLLDHAANERKASAMAMSMVAHYPDRPRLVSEMIDLALEEMNHFRQVYRLIEARGLMLTADDKDPYVNALRRRMDKTREPYLLDRLLTGSVIEARGAERFSLIAGALEMTSSPPSTRSSRVLRLSIKAVLSRSPTSTFNQARYKRGSNFGLTKKRLSSLKSRSGRVCIDESEGSSFEGSDQIPLRPRRARN